MKEKKKIDFTNIIFTIIKVICIIMLILLIFVLTMQRFSNNEIAIGGYRVFNVATGSMVPDYEIGDVLIAKEVDIDTLVEGDDVSYLGKEGTFAGRVVTHRIEKIEEGENGKVFITKGTANKESDPPISGDQIYGKIIYKSVIISLLTKLMNNMTAFYVLVFIPLGLLIFLQIKDIMDSKRENDEDTDTKE